MSRKAVFLALAACLLIALPAAANDIKIVNSSQWAIYHFQLSPTDNENWGPDQLQDHVVQPNSSFTLKGVPCDTYDVKLIDEDGDECIVAAVDVCAGAEEWHVSSEDLAACEGYGPNGE